MGREEEMVTRPREGSRQVTGAPPSSPREGAGINIWAFLTSQLPSGQAQLTAGPGSPRVVPRVELQDTQCGAVGPSPLCLSSLTPRSSNPSRIGQRCWCLGRGGAGEQEERTASASCWFPSWISLRRRQGGRRVDVLPQFGP